MNHLSNRPLTLKTKHKSNTAASTNRATETASTNHNSNSAGRCLFGLMAISSLISYLVPLLRDDYPIAHKQLPPQFSDSDLVNCYNKQQFSQTSLNQCDQYFNNRDTTTLAQHYSTTELFFEAELSATKRQGLNKKFATIVSYVEKINPHIVNDLLSGKIDFHLNSRLEQVYKLHGMTTSPNSRRTGITFNISPSLMFTGDPEMLATFLVHEHFHALQLWGGKIPFQFNDDGGVAGISNQPKFAKFRDLQQQAINFVNKLKTSNFSPTNIIVPHRLVSAVLNQKVQIFIIFKPEVDQSYKNRYEAVTYQFSQAVKRGDITLHKQFQDKITSWVANNENGARILLQNGVWLTLFRILNFYPDQLWLNEYGAHLVSFFGGSIELALEFMQQQNPELCKGMIDFFNLLTKDGQIAYISQPLCHSLS